MSRIHALPSLVGPPSGTVSTSLPLGHSSLHGRSLCITPLNASRLGQRGTAIEAKYRGVGTDRSKVAQFRRSEADVGSTEVQIAQLSARVEQLTTHLQQNRKDYAATRGLNALLGQRRKLLLYLYNTNRPKYEELLSTLGIRPLKAQAARGVMIKLRGDAAE